MQRIGWRLLRIALVATAAYAAFVWLQPRGLGWVVLPAALVSTLLVSGYRWMRVRRAGASGGREGRWAEAMLDTAKRPAAVAEVRREVARLEPVREATRSEHARLTVLLAQLLDAGGRNDEGLRLLDGLDFDALGPVDAALVRHGLAVLRLRADDARGALEVLEGRRGKSGEPELDLRLDLLEASARLELGEPERALETATRARRAAGGDEELIVEARVVRAAALDALGNRSDALDVLRSLGADVIEMLSQLGQRRVRELAEAARAAPGE